MCECRKRSKRARNVVVHKIIIDSCSILLYTVNQKKDKQYITAQNRYKDKNTHFKNEIAENGG